MRFLLTTLLFLCGIFAHAARLAPWNPCGEGARVVVPLDGSCTLRRTTFANAEAFSYDLVGNLLSASNTLVRETFTYDRCDRLTNAVTRVGADVWTFAWKRDAGGLVTNVVYSVGRSVSRAYDAAGRLVSVTDWLGHAWTFTWNGFGCQTGGTSPDGTFHSFTYDAYGNLVAWSVGQSSSILIK